MVLALGPGIFAHHGSTGIYNFSRPYYVEGVVVSAEYAYPHAEIVVKVKLDEKTWSLPSFVNLEKAEGRKTSGLLKAVPPPDSSGDVEISFDGNLTREILAHKARPKVGETVRAVVYRRDSRDRYMGEFRVMMLSFSDDRQIILGKRPYFRELG